MQLKRTLLLFVLLALALAACQRDTPANDGPEATETPAATVEEAVEETAEATPTAEEADETAAATPTVEEETSGTDGEGTSDGSAEADSSPPTPGTVEEDRTTVMGRVLAKGTGEPITETYVMLAGVHREDGAGAFVLDTASAPTTMSNNGGYFIFENIEPHEYVVVVGDPYHYYSILTNPETEKAQTITPEAGEVLDLEEFEVEWEE